MAFKYLWLHSIVPFQPLIVYTFKWAGKLFFFSCTIPPYTILPYSMMKPNAKLWHNSLTQLIRQVSVMLISGHRSFFSLMCHCCHVLLKVRAKIRCLFRMPIIACLLFMKDTMGSLTSTHSCWQMGHPAWRPSNGWHTLWCKAVSFCIHLVHHMHLLLPLIPPHTHCLFKSASILAFNSAVCISPLSQMCLLS